MPFRPQQIGLLAALLLIVPLVSCTNASDESEAEFALGNAALSRLDFKQAMLHFDETIRLNPKHAGAFFKRGRTLWQGSEFEKALLDLTRAIELDPDLTWAYFFRAASLVSLNRYDDSLGDLDHVIDTDAFEKPDMVRAHTWRAIAHQNLKNYDAAIHDYTRCIELHPDRYIHRADRGWVYEMTGKTEEAVEDYNVALSMDGLDREMERLIEGRIIKLGGVPMLKSSETSAPATTD